MMQKLVEIMGKEAYQEGIREYLKTYAYSNATWDDLITILDAKSEEDLATFSDVWVNQKGMPHITFTNRCGQLEIRQRDPLNRGLLWPQRFQITFQGTEGNTSVEVNLTNETYALTVPLGTEAILPKITSALQRKNIKNAPNLTPKNCIRRFKKRAYAVLFIYYSVDILW